MRSVFPRLGCLLLLFASVPLFASGSQAERPNILFILVDTLRKDTLRLYGYEQKNSKLELLRALGYVD